MSFVATVPPSRANAEVVAAYRYLYRVAGGKIPGRIFRVLSLRPSTMVRFVRNWELASWAGNEPRQNRELMAVVVSRLASCDY
jgi:hypothetical protein